MARMIGAFLRPWCPYCRCAGGPDCPGTGRQTKRAQRAHEERQWRKEQC